MQLTNAQHIENHEKQIRDLRKEVADFADLEKLVANPLFRKVILQRFCVEECARYAQLSADPSLPSDAARADALGIAQAAGHLRRWIQVMQRQAELARGTIHDLEQNLEILRQEPEDGTPEAPEFH